MFQMPNTYMGPVATMLHNIDIEHFCYFRKSCWADLNLGILTREPILLSNPFYHLPLTNTAVVSGGIAISVKWGASDRTV